MMDDIVKRLRDRQSMRTWSATGDTPKQALFADTLCHDAAAEIERLRSALAGLVQVYVINGVATTPAKEVGDAWEAAQRALLKA